MGLGWVVLPRGWGQPLSVPSILMGQLAKAGLGGWMTHVAFGTVGQSWNKSRVFQLSQDALRWKGAAEESA